MATKKKKKPVAIHHPKDYPYFTNGIKDIRTTPSNPKYRSNYDKIFRKNKTTKDEQ